MIAKKEPEQITEAQRRILARMLELERRFYESGYFPQGGQYKSMKILEDKKLVTFVGYGRDIDGLIEKDVPVWKLTVSGRKLAKGV